MGINKGPVKALAGLLSVACVMTATQASVSANPFGSIGNVMDTVNDVNATINDFEGAINGSPHSILSLSQTLGLDSEAMGVIDAVEATQQVFQLYDVWSKGLSAADQENVTWLVTQALGNDMSMDALAASSWFLSKTGAEQSQVTSTFLQLQDMVEATGQDKGQFLNYAACLASGGTCAP